MCDCSFCVLLMVPPEMVVFQPTFLQHLRCLADVFISPKSFHMWSDYNNNNLKCILSYWPKQINTFVKPTKTWLPSPADRSWRALRLSHSSSEAEHSTCRHMFLGCSYSHTQCRPFRGHPSAYITLQIPIKYQHCCPRSLPHQTSHRGLLKWFDQVFVEKRRRKTL